MYASIAQLDRAPVCGTGGQEFESLWAYHFFITPPVLPSFIKTHFSKIYCFVKCQKQIAPLLTVYLIFDYAC